jgi:hypothetical protein
VHMRVDSAKGCSEKESFGKHVDRIDIAFLRTVQNVVTWYDFL